MTTFTLKQWLFFPLQFWHSTIGKKIVVALTGIALLLFLAGHLSGNLLYFAGQKSFNDYAHFLHTFLHGGGIWLSRIGLIAAFALHIIGTIQLSILNRKAQQPKKTAVIQASKSSRIMIVSGLIILSFVIFHLLHFKVMAEANASAYNKVTTGFEKLPIVLFYVIAISLLASHLSHGFTAVFQTLGLRSKRNAVIINLLGKTYALVIWIGFCAIPIIIYCKHQ